MSELVTIIVDGKEVQVPRGTTVVDAAKRVDVDIPVFCHHPKLEPVGMCRMCLVEIGLPTRDRATGELVLDEDGKPQIAWGRVLQTGCTVRVTDGMVVRTTSEVVDEAREGMIEFLLTSHPLDCPICDKGGECPLQNLTMAHGLGETAFDYEDKIHNEKHVPLGELIYLDRERCIQCARCTRFQDEIAGDPVIGFHNRGRKLEIVTFSDPGFDSIWSGNTTDLCPVGALTTSDFRFAARPWELTPVASISPHGPEGENITVSTRQEASANGRVVIKRIMPRQNEQVNEIWISDRTRFAHHFADAADRLQKPLVRQDGRLVEAEWDEALELVASRLRAAGQRSAGVAGDRPSNEDLFAFQRLIRQGLQSPNVAQAHPRLAGGEVTARVGIAAGSNLLELGRGDAILVIASDLHEEAPIWWLRVKQAAERGAKLVVLNVRPTRLDPYATHVVHYEPGEALQAARQLLSSAQIEGQGEGVYAGPAEALLNAVNLVAFYGYEGLTYDETDVLAKTLANLLLIKNGDGRNHAGRRNNGLIAVWPHNNTQGAWDMGIHPELGPGYQKLATPGLKPAEIYRQAQAGELHALYVLGADPIGDGLMAGRGRLDFLVVQEHFLTATAQAADVVLPAQSWAERDGTFTSGERRVQRYYPAIPPVGSSRPDWLILEQIGEKLGLEKARMAASLVFKQGIAAAVPQYQAMDYRTLARVEKQFPNVGGEDQYYGGTSYENRHGLGQQWPAAAESEEVPLYQLPEGAPAPSVKFPVIRAAALFTPGTLITHSEVLQPRLARPTLHLHASDAARLNLSTGDPVVVHLKNGELEVAAQVNYDGPKGVAVVVGVPFKAGLLEAKIEKRQAAPEAAVEAG